MSRQHSGCSEEISEAKSVTKGLALVGMGYVSQRRSWQNVCQKVVKRAHATREREEKEPVEERRSA